jgi:hypothetical protein
MTIKSKHNSLIERVNNIEKMLSNILGQKEATRLISAPAKNRGSRKGGLTEYQKKALVFKRNQVALK